MRKYAQDILMFIVVGSIPFSFIIFFYCVIDEKYKDRERVMEAWDYFIPVTDRIRTGERLMNIDIKMYFSALTWINLIWTINLFT